MLLNKRIDIGTVTCAQDSRISPRLRANTTALVQITVRISNILFNNILLCQVSVPYMGIIQTRYSVQNMNI